MSPRIVSDVTNDRFIWQGDNKSYLKVDDYGIPKLVVLALMVDRREQNEMRNLGSRHRWRHHANSFY